MIEVAVPTFNLKDLRKKVIQSNFRSCLVENGFFYLQDYGMLEDEHRLINDITVDFFMYGCEAQKSCVTSKDSRIRRGYSVLEAESVAKASNIGEYSDFSMCYSMGMSNNLFPSVEFENIWNSYFTQMYKVAREIAIELLKAVEVDVEVSSSFVDYDPVLRFRYFPEVPHHRCAEHQPLRMGTHYDLSVITLIHQTPCDNGFVSLQCEANGSFVDLPPVPNSLVVICGGVSTLISGGKVKAPKHQVLAPPLRQKQGSSRTSSVFFLRPEANFEFSVPLAKAYGFDVSLPSDTATFADWIGENYINMRVPDKGT